MFTEKDAEKALIEFMALKGKERAKLIERMFRLETRHFKSTQFQVCGSPGMEDGNWSGLDESKFEKVKMKDNHLTGEKQMRTFIKWHNILDFCVYLSDYIDRHKGNYGRWNSMNAEKQAKYMRVVGTIKNRFIV